MQELFAWLGLPAEYQPVFTTLFAGTAVGAATWLVKGLPAQLWNWIYRNITTTVEVSSMVDSNNPGGSREFVKLSTWLINNSFKFLGRSFRVDIAWHNASLISGRFASFVFFYKGRLFTASTSSKDLQNGRCIDITVTVFGLLPQRSLIEGFLKDLDIVKDFPDQPLRLISYTTDEDSPVPTCIGSLATKRDLDSVFIAAGTKEIVYKEFAEFETLRSWRVAHGLRHKRTILLEGPPGTGKSSWVLALASHFDWTLVSVSMENVNANTLRAALMEDSGNRPKVVLLEDVDYNSAFWNRKKIEEMELSGNRQHSQSLRQGDLLNLLDGVNGINNTIVIMTTNRPEILEPTVTRAGRVDLRVHIPPFDAECTKDFIEYNYPELTGRFTLAEVAKHHYSGSELSWLMGMYQNDAEAFLAAVVAGERPTVLGLVNNEETENARAA